MKILEQFSEGENSVSLRQDEMGYMVIGNQMGIDFALNEYDEAKKTYDGCVKDIKSWGRSSK